jgi:hypothetical protein
MAIDYERFQIPTEFADYTRRLIIYSEPEFMRANFDKLFGELRKYGALEKTMDFPVGDLAVKVVYLSDESVTIAEVIADVRPRFAMFRFEGDARMGVTALAAPNDRLYPSQWALHQIEAEAAWSRVAQVPARPPVTVAIVDSGIQRNHEDLAGASISALRIIPPSTGTFADDTGHGTMIAGIIGAVANNAIGMAGEARNVDILALKITDERTPPTALAAVAGMLIAANSGAKIINASWHVLEDSGLLSHTTSVACQHCVVVVAAGNYGSNNTEIPTLPASYGFQNMVVTMASDRHDDKCWFSNYGATVDLAAPGMRVQSTGIYYINPRYPDHSGTSPAAAHVSAAAALLLAIDNWTPNEIREHLNASADRPRSLQGICRSEGRLNLRRAVEGPFAIVRPAAGQSVPKGSLFNVEWHIAYNSPVVNTVEISVNGVVLAAGLPNNRHHVVTLPGVAMPGAVLRVKCEQKNLYADSPPFDIF